MAAAIAVRRIGIDQTGVVPAEFTVRVTHRSIPARAAPASQPKLHAIVAAVRLHNTRTLGAERRRVEVVHAGAVRNHHWPVQHIRERCPRITNVEAEIVRNRHVLDGIHQTAACVTRFQNPVRGDRPVGAGCEFAAFDGLHVRLDRGIARVGLGGAEVHVLNETARVHTGRRTGRRTAAAGGPRVSIACSASFRDWPSAGASSRARSPAASSR